jgi:hypothetical protein
METTFFGLGYDFDAGSDPGVAINADGTVVEVHKNEAGTSLYARTGTLNQAQITWNDTGSDRKSYTGGKQPAVAMNGRGDVVEVHKRETGDKIFAMYGTISGTSILWGKSEDYDSDGHDPAVAVNYNRQVVSVYAQGNDEVKYRRGSLNTTDKTVEFRAEQDLGDGQYPKVAMDDAGNVIAVWEQFVDGKNKLRCCVGKLSTDLDTIIWGTVTDLVEEVGFRPCVGLTSDGFVVAAYSQGSNSNQLLVNLKQLIGRINPGNKTVAWQPAMYFDDGIHPAVAAAGTTAVRIAQGETLNRLWYSTSLITDRASWMQDRLDQLGSKMVKQLFIPGSHDAGMYTGGFSTLGKTQELSIYGQLAAGQRYFDLRVEWNDPVFHLHHNGINGPLLSDVLQQIADFCNEQKELVILCFSHFSHFGETSDSTIYDKFVAEVSNKISPWMVTTKPSDRRLADVTLSDYISDGMALLVVVDEEWPVKYPETGFWVFRNSESETASEGDLRVFDQYAKDKDYDDVKKDQTEKYEAYNGYCDPETTSLCDLFLLSWTCTSPVGAGVWQVSKDVNRHLGDFMVNLTMPNEDGYYPNIIYVDYCEFARATDVVLYADGTPNVTAAKTTPHLEIKKGASENASGEGNPQPETPPRSDRPLTA